MRQSCEICLQGHLNIQEKVSLHHMCPYITCVHIWQVSLHHMCPYMTGVPTSHVSIYDRCPYMTSAPTSQVSLHDKCPYIAGVLTWQVSLHRRCPYMTSVPTSQVSLHDKCPYITGVILKDSLTWQCSEIPSLRGPHAHRHPSEVVHTDLYISIWLLLNSESYSVALP